MRCNSIIVFIVSFLCLFHIQIKAASVGVGGIYYLLDASNNTAQVTSSPNNSYSGSISIPSSILCDGVTYNVTSIGKNAFNSCSSLNIVNIANSITSIGSSAFAHCTGLSSMSIPNSVTSIGSHTFWGCSNLSNIELPSSITSIPDYFAGSCTKLQSINIPSSISSIGKLAFEGCTSLSSITLPNSITSIGQQAFMNCTELILVISKIQNPFPIEADVFYGVHGMTLQVPKGTKSLYEQYIGWHRGYITIVEESNSYNLSISVSGNGTVAYNGENIRSTSKSYTINEGTNITISISPDDGYQIKSIKVNNSSVSASSSYSTTINSDTKIEVEFEAIPPKTYKLTVVASGNGSASYGGESIRGGSKSFTVNEGTSAKISFSPDSGYRIKSVKVNGSGVDAGSSYTVTVNSNTKVEVEFEAIPVTTYTLTITASGNGSASYGGESIRGGSKSFTVNEGTSAKISFSPDSGYRIKSVKVNGSGVDAGSSYTVTVNSNTKVEVEFEAIPVTTYTLTITASGNGSASYGGESIRGGSKSFTVNEGTSAKISFSPDSGYRIKSVKVNGSGVDAGSSYTVTVNSNTKVEVEFEAIPENPTPTPTPTTYTLSISASGNGTASYSGSSIRSTTRSFTVNEGTSVTISFSPDDGYQIKSVSVNGSTVSAGSSYTVTVNSNITVAVEFEAKPVDPIPVSTDYTLTISATGNGYASFGIHKITNQTASFTVTAGQVAIIDFVPGDGCRIKSVTANGSSIEVDSHNSVWLTINSNTVVSVVFEKIPVVTYTLTISAIGNGIASYNGTSVRNDSRDFSVSEGSNPNVSFTPDDFNLVKTVKLNGLEVSLSDNSYTISNVSSDNKIEVEFEEIDAKFTTEGVNYQVSSYESRTVVIGEGEYGLSLEVPEKVVSQGYEWTISGISDEAMSANKELAAIIWNPSTTINFRNVNPNLLLYVKDARYAPYGVNNVVINNEAESILLTESPSGNNFYCPIAFTAKKITYSHRYRMRTGGGDSRGWETIALPFDVQRIEHVEEGEILPFAKWSSTSTEKPFWLYQLGASGFIEAEGIKANTPYVISMPNNDVYQDNYKLRGTVTFSSTNVEVKKSDDIVKTTYGNRTLIPNFINLDNNAGYYALNVNNDMESYQGQENEGSVFIQNLRRIHPFEAYMTSTSGTRAIGVFDGMTTAIKGIEDIEKGLHILKVYNLNGQCIKTVTSMESLKHELPAGIYIINNKKIIIK